MYSRNSLDYVSGHTMPKEFVLIQEYSQLKAYNTKAANPDGNGFEVFVLNLPRDILIQGIYNFMQKSGEIYEIRVLMDFSGFNRGMCYIKFLTRIAARRAVLVLDACDILPDHPVYIRMSLDNKRLVLQNLPACIPRNLITQLVTSTIGEGITSISFQEDQIGSGYANCCFVTYEDHRKAMEARKKLWPGIEAWNTIITVEWAEPPELKQSRILYFKHFPENATRLDLFEVLSSIIDIHTVLKLRLNNGTGCIIFTGYETRNEARIILSDLHILGRKLHLTYKRFGTFRNLNTNVLPTDHYNENQKLNVDYRDCFSAMLKQVPVFYPMAVHAAPGFYNEIEAIQNIIHEYLEENYPNSTWSCLDPNQTEIPSNFGAIRIVPTVNNQMYDFVLICLSTDLASGSARFTQFQRCKI